VLVSEFGVMEAWDNNQQQPIGESYTVYRSYCSGRRNCSGVLTTIQLIPRHDILSLCMHLISPVKDTLTVEIGIPDHQDPLLFIVYPKKFQRKMKNGMLDQEKYGSQLKSPSDSLFVYGEAPELCKQVLSSSVLKLLLPNVDLLLFLHFTDHNFSSDLRVHSRVLKMQFKIPKSDIGRLRELMILCCFMVDVVARCSLSADTKSSILKTRKRIESEYQKQSSDQDREDRRKEELKNLSPASASKREEKDQKKSQKKKLGSKVKVLR